MGPTKNLYPESKQEFLPVIASADVTESIIAQSWVIDVDMLG